MAPTSDGMRLTPGGVPELKAAPTLTCPICRREVPLGDYLTPAALGADVVLMAAANSSGGVMGKMIDAQSIVVASTATRWYGHEGSILRFVFFHSVALAILVGLLVMGQAYVWPMTLLAP